MEKTHRHYRKSKYCRNWKKSKLKENLKLRRSSVLWTKIKTCKSKPFNTTPKQHWLKRINLV